MVERVLELELHYLLYIICYYNISRTTGIKIIFKLSYKILFPILGTFLTIDV